MKLNKSILLAAAVMLSLTSCLKDQADVFDVPSSQRMQDYLENARTLLQQPENGWVLSYYPGSAYATCYMGVKFTSQQVTAYSQSDPETAVTSSYKLTTDDGAVLSFDTYNSVLHYYATSDASHYQARGGDFEFDIMNVTDERITLRGKRSRNLCYLDRMPNSEEIPAFLARMNAAEEELNIVAFSGVITGGLVEGFLDGGTHTLTIGHKGAESNEMTAARYMVVPGGIHINEPFTFQGVTFQDFTYNDEAGTFSGSGLTFKKVIPEGYVPYKQFLGRWTFNWYNDSQSFPIELVAFEDGKTYKMKGLSSQFEPVLGYNGARGQLTWNAQAVGTSSGLTIMLAAWDLAQSGGNLVWDTEAGLIGFAQDNTVEKLVVEWKDNGQSDLTVDSWVLWGVNADGSSAGSFSGWTMASGSYQLPYLTTMTKIVE